MPAINTANLAIGVAYIWTAAGDTAKPATTIAYGGTISGYTYVGATREGVTVARSIDVNRLYVEEQAESVMTTPGTATLSVSADLAEVSMANLKLAFGSGSLATASGITTFTPANELAEYAVVVDGQNELGLFRRWYIPRATSVAPLEIANRRAENYQSFGLTFESTCAITEIKVENDDAP